MRRNMELIRKIVLAIEDAPTFGAPQPLEVAAFTEGEIRAHAYLMIEAKLADGIEYRSGAGGPPEGIITRLTWAGHDFADSARNETIWQTTVAWIGEKAGSVSFDVFKQSLSAVALDTLGIG